MNTLLKKSVLSNLVLIIITYQTHLYLERFKRDLYDYITRVREQRSKQIEKLFGYIPLNKQRQSSYIHQYTLNEEKN